MSYVSQYVSTSYTTKKHPTSLHLNGRARGAHAVVVRGDHVEGVAVAAAKVGHTAGGAVSGGTGGVVPILTHGDYSVAVGTLHLLPRHPSSIGHAVQTSSHVSWSARR